MSWAAIPDMSVPGRCEVCDRRRRDGVAPAIVEVNYGYPPRTRNWATNYGPDHPKAVKDWWARPILREDELHQHWRTDAAVTRGGGTPDPTIARDARQRAAEDPEYLRRSRSATVGNEWDLQYSDGGELRCRSCGARPRVALTRLYALAQEAIRLRQAYFVV
jgi:hypothetical protein